jgi:hypothetical protein
MPSKAGGPSGGMNTASTARASAHPYAHPAGRPSKRQTSTEEKPQLSQSPGAGSAVSPTDSNTTQPPTNTAHPTSSSLTSKSRKKKNNGNNSGAGGGDGAGAAAASNIPKSNRQQFSACHACRYRRLVPNPVFPLVSRVPTPLLYCIVMDGQPIPPSLAYNAPFASHSSLACYARCIDFAHRFPIAGSNATSKTSPNPPSIPTPISAVRIVWSVGYAAKTIMRRVKNSLEGGRGLISWNWSESTV